MRSFSSSHRLIFILGDMRELGAETEVLHKRLAEEITDILPHNDPDIVFFLVGPYMRKYILPILEKKYTVTSLLSSRDAGQEIKKLLIKKSKKPTMIYVKGSQNTIFLEEAIEILLDDPADRVRLCRQTPDWKRKKEEFFRSL